MPSPPAPEPPVVPEQPVAPTEPEPVAPEKRGIAALIFAAVPSVLGFVLAAIFLTEAHTITGPEAVYPVALAIAVLVLGAVNLVRDLLGRARGATDTEADGPLTWAAVLRLLAFVAVLLAALVLLEPVGFFPAMAVMTIGGLVCFGVRNPLVIAAATVLIVGWSYLIFVRLLVVPFPPGFLGLP